MTTPKRIQICKRCNGAGWVEDYSKKELSFDRAKVCPKCDGKGQVAQ